VNIKKQSNNEVVGIKGTQVTSKKTITHMCQTFHRQLLSILKTKCVYGTSASSL